jgi:hypothetical protein
MVVVVVVVSKGKCRQFTVTVCENKIRLRQSCVREASLFFTSPSSVSLSKLLILFLLLWSPRELDLLVSII